MMNPTIDCSQRCLDTTSIRGIKLLPNFSVFVKVPITLMNEDFNDKQKDVIEDRLRKNARK